MLKANYHTHTKRCGHATGSDEDYITSAIGNQISILGFSDHIMLPGFSEPKIRGEYSLLDDYLDSISELKDKYKEKIDILTGFEAESFPLYFRYYKQLLDQNMIDYLILGNHNIMDDNKKLIWDFKKIDSASRLYKYRDLAIDALQTGMFSIFAHPDYFMWSIKEFDSDCKKVSKDLIDACIKYDIPLEVNVGGIRNGKEQIGKSFRYGYPSIEFFKIAAKKKAKCILGIDAHNPSNLLNNQSIYLAFEFASKLNLNLIDICDKIKHRS